MQPSSPGAVAALPRVIGSRAVGTVPTQHVGGNVLRVGGSPGDWRSAVLLAGVATQAVN